MHLPVRAEFRQDRPQLLISMECSQYRCHLPVNMEFIKDRIQAWQSSFKMCQRPLCSVSGQFCRHLFCITWISLKFLLAHCGCTQHPCVFDTRVSNEQTLQLAIVKQELQHQLENQEKKFSIGTYTKFSVMAAPFVSL